jgi:hypothetical protein
MSWGDAACNAAAIAVVDEIWVWRTSIAIESDGLLVIADSA